MEEIKVTVVEFGDRKHYQLQYRDPLSGRKKTKSSGVERTGRKREWDAAQRAAGEWEKELQSGTYRPPSKITWTEFRTRYENEVLSSLAENTDRKVGGVLNTVETIIHPERLRDVTAARLSHYQSKLREQGLSENTIKGHLAHLGAALNWAQRMGMLPVVPTIERPRRAKHSKLMKGRPIAGEEFDRMLAKVRVAVLGEPPKVEAGQEPPKVDPEREAHEAAIVASWQRYLRGLWASGLRLGESLDLFWDRDDKLRVVDLDGKRPMLRVPAELEKGHKDRLLPIAPEFVAFLRETPAAERKGRVFNPLAKRVKGPRLTEHRVGELVSKIGKAAGVKVNTDARTGKVKYASAHDLRRSFGARWASRVMPQVLMELMRHESIETTLRYYVGQNAERTADALWAAYETAASNTSGNTPPAGALNPETDDSVNLDVSGT